jgi:peptidoglycan hydrolase-like protein with peptidoglycan-binding domain
LRILALLGCLAWITAAGAPAPRKAPPPSKKTAPKKSAPSPSKKTAAPSKKTATPSKKTAAPSRKTATPSKKTATPSRKRPAPSKKTTSKSKKRLPAWRTSQQTPTRERYLEIQQALAARGFLDGPPTGIWGPDSVAALKKFQASQNLEPTGKLDSLSLIALGLGPKREANGAKPAPLSEPKLP